jgi:hypothetical protein
MVRDRTTALGYVRVTSRGSAEESAFHEVIAAFAAGRRLTVREVFVARPDCRGWRALRALLRQLRKGASGTGVVVVDDGHLSRSRWVRPVVRGLIVAFSRGGRVMVVTP